MPLTSASGMPSAISLQVKSNSSRQTKSIASDAVSELCGSTCTFAPTRPMTIDGLRFFRSSQKSASVGNDGVLVWMMTRSYPAAIFSVSSTPRPSAGASSTRLSGTRAAGCASHVGYQNERISRFAW